MSDFDRAEEMAFEALKFDLDSVDRVLCLRNLAEILTYKKDYIEALSWYEKLKSEIKLGAKDWNNLGVIYFNMNRNSEAKESFKKAVDLEPDNIQYNSNYNLFNETNN